MRPMESKLNRTKITQQLTKALIAARGYGEPLSGGIYYDPATDKIRFLINPLGTLVVDLTKVDPTTKAEYLVDDVVRIIKGAG